MDLITWFQTNYAELLKILTLMVVVGEMVTRLTPTKKDDGFIRRLGAIIDTALGVMKVPNLRKKLEDDGPKVP